MPKLKENQNPSYRLHKQSGQGIVTLSGKDHLLGEFGTKESRAKYKLIIRGSHSSHPVTAAADSYKLAIGAKGDVVQRRRTAEQ